LYDVANMLRLTARRAGGLMAVMARPGRRLSLGALLLLVAGAIVAGCGDGDDSGTADGPGALAGSSIRLEPAAAEQPDPFVDANLDVAEGSGQAAPAEPVDPPETGDEVSTSLSGRIVEGSAEGLYGGSLDTAVCDGPQFLSFITDPANRAQADAWAEVQGITPEEIPDYFAGLTPVRLRLDTRVTNHGFDGSRPVPFQSVLQAGTAVLVDERGVPRFKCFCGNPLTEPEPVEGDPGSGALDLDALAENPEDAWPGLDPAAVVTVEPGDASDAFVLGDVQTGERFERPKGTNGTDDTPAPPTGSDDTATTATTGPTSSGGDDTGGGGSGCRIVEQPDGDRIEICDGGGTPTTTSSGGGSAGTICEHEYGPNGEIISTRCYVP
jgi:hypothetical protein